MKNREKITVVYGVIIVGLFLVALVLIVVPRILNVTPYVIGDNQMAPQYKKNSLVFVRETPTKEVHAGDSITYYENQSQIVKTRRVVDVDLKLDGFYVKGDNVSSAEMGLVHSRNLIGQPLFAIPWLGVVEQLSLMNLVKVSLLILAVILTGLTIFSQKQYRHVYE